MINKDLDIKILRNQFSISNPNHVVIENLFDQDFIKECEEEFLNIDDSLFFKYDDIHFEFEKYSMNEVKKMPNKLKALFNYVHSPEFINFIEDVTGFDKLFVDDKRWGGGLHKTKPGGYLSIHKDFNVLPESYKSDIQLLRTVNLIGYLTDEDQTNNQGDLEFWQGDKVIKIKNKFNSWILFDTRENYHGHPYPFRGIKPRMSIASYYYKEEPILEDLWKSTSYIKLPWMEDSEEYKKKRNDRANPKLRYKNKFNKIL